MRRPHQTVEILAAVQPLRAQSRQVQDLDHGRARAPPLDQMTDQMSIQPATPGLAGHPFCLAAGVIPVTDPNLSPAVATTDPGRKAPR
jgi:hypothetical protein